MKPVFLVGYMGSGKSTLGLTVSRKLKCQFIDLDLYIESRFRKSIKELFNDRGEEAFRKLEQSILHEVADFEDVIVSCGGGTPLYEDNMDYMNERGHTVWLNASVDVLHSRLSIPSAKAKRPLLAGKSDTEMREFIENSLAARVGHYSRAKYVFDADKLDTRDQLSAATEKLAGMILDMKSE